MTAPYSPPLDEVTTALLDLLNSNPAGRTVYDGAYGDDPLGTDPHGILYPIPGGSADPMPDLDGDWRTVTAAWQVSSVARWRNQCQRTGQMFADLILARDAAGWAHPLAMPDGWQCIDRRPDPSPPGVIRTGEHPNAVFTHPARYLLTITPA